MSDETVDSVVRCRFDGCDAPTVARVVLAVVDQVAAAADADMAVLEALDYPLTDGIASLSECGIDTIEVRGSDGAVRIDVYVDRVPQDVVGALGDAQDAVETFFDVTFPEASVVRMVGSLR